MRRTIDRRRLEAIVANVAVAAEQIGPVSWRVSRAGSCEAPRLVELVGVPLCGAGPVGVAKDSTRLYLEMRVRCRRCPSCLDWRRKMWAARSVCEMVGRKTWMGTLTLDAVSLYKAECAARLWLDGRGVPDPSPSEWTDAVSRQVVPDIQRYFKRVRKNSGARLRLVYVPELGSRTRRLHYHALVTCIEGGLLKRHLLGWPLGFTKWKLVKDESKAAFYVAKYIGKDAVGRLRASLRYGRSEQIVDLTPVDQRVSMLPDSANEIGTGL